MNMLKKEKNTKSQKRVYFISSIYALGRFCLGLFLHPYQTMQLIVEQKIFVWLTLLPSFFLVLLSLSWRLMIRPFLLFLKMRTDFGHVFFDSVLVSNASFFVMIWIISFCVYWQVILLYLLFRFSSAFRGK